MLRHVLYRRSRVMRIILVFITSSYAHNSSSIVSRCSYLRVFCMCVCLHDLYVCVYYTFRFNGMFNKHIYLYCVPSKCTRLALYFQVSFLSHIILFLLVQRQGGQNGTALLLSLFTIRHKPLLPSSIQVLHSIRIPYPPYRAGAKM
jgi:CDP-diglyceride synthetase